jgi:O-succinylbenzoate synthase
MLIEQIEIFQVSMPLAHPFETSFGRWQQRDCILVAAHSQGLIGWGECAAMDRPWYSYETTGTAWHILSEFLIPNVLTQPWNDIDEFIELTAWVRGHPMAKAGLQMAAWDLLAQRDGKSLANKLAEPYPQGARARVAVGISLGIEQTIEDTLSQIEEAVRAGYRRIKLKIKPGRDVEMARAARHDFPTLPLMLDANSAYTLNDVPTLRELDDLDLLMIEQPLGYDDIFEHSKLQKQLNTRICLDESIHTPDQARWAVEIDAARVINIKAGRVGGLWEGRQIHDICMAYNVPVWCGGMMETGVGRAANLAIASLPNFTLPGDISATEHYWAEDIVDELFVLNTDDSTITVPSRPGLGVTVNRNRLSHYQVRSAAFGSTT